MSLFQPIIVGILCATILGACARDSSTRDFQLRVKNEDPVPGFSCANLPESLCFDTESGDILLMQYDAMTSQAAIYSYLQQQVITTVNIPEELTDGKMWINLPHPDTLVVVNRNRRWIGTLDLQGRICDSTRFPDALPNTPTISLFFTMLTKPLYLEGHYVMPFMRGVGSSDNMLVNLYEGSMFVKWSPADSNSFTGIGMWPAELMDPSNFAADVIPLFSNRHDSAFYYCTFAGHHVYRYKVLENKLERFYLPSDHFTSFEPIPVDQFGDNAVLESFYVTNSIYANMVYDPYKNCLYRAVFHSLPPTREDGLANLVMDKIWSIQVIDVATMETQGHISLPEGQSFLSSMIIPAPDGLLMAYTTPQSDSQYQIALYEWE